MLDFRTASKPRGCGERQPGGVYAETGRSPYGRDLKEFMLDPPLPLPSELDLIRKPQLWPRKDPGSGQEVVDPETGKPVFDVLIQIGAAYYPEVPDYVEEVRDRGASRRLNPQMAFTRLTRHSRMLLAHPHAIIADWQQLSSPRRCQKAVPAHDQGRWRRRAHVGPLPVDSSDSREGLVNPERQGPCLFKLWEVLPREEAVAVFEREDGGSVCIRQIGSTTYEYCPTGETVTTWQTGFILALPITNIALIQYSDGSVNERAKCSLEAARELHKDAALPFYETES
jgi:hypothetical protein